jgi:spore germination cell wall hydrolase CwlJ-like protein
MMQLVKRWSMYIAIFIVAMFLTDQYREYRQLQELEAVRQDLIRQEKEAEKNCLKNALWYEAGNQSLYGIEAVAAVIHNRKMHPDYPSTYCGVINQRSQFSYTLLGKPDVEIIKANFRPMEVKAYAKVEEVAEKVMSEEFKPVLESSVRFYATKAIKNYWTKTKEVAARIGDHVFYKDKEKK